MFGRKRSKDEEQNRPAGEEWELLDEVMAVHASLERDEHSIRRPRGRAALLHPDDSPEYPH